MDDEIDWEKDVFAVAIFIGSELSRDWILTGSDASGKMKHGRITFWFHHCELGIAIFVWEVTWNYAYSLFKLLFRKNGSTSNWQIYTIYNDSEYIFLKDIHIEAMNDENNQRFRGKFTAD